MAAGIQVFTPSGDLQIDDSFLNYRFLGKSTIIADTYGDSFNWAGTWYKDVADYCYPGELLAFRREDIEFEPDTTRRFATTASASYLISNNGKIGFRVLPESNYGYFDTNRPLITIYRFGLTTENEKGKHFEVFDSTGKLVFSDGRNYMRVVQGLNGLDLALPTGYGDNRPIPAVFANINHSPSIKTAMAILSTAFYWETAPGYTWEVAHGFAFYPDRVEVRYVLSGGYSEGGGVQWDSQRHYHILMLDVTGL
ncbi:MAG: hypothetical protein K0Q77_6 [Anaerosporomusa subterranea]|jgi:hypothetical protein|nr:hypothetical protein [Anaerosporomusa subterranea]